jgi:hypothetical protein
MSLPTLILTWTRHQPSSFFLWVCWNKFNIHMYTRSLFSLQPWRWKHHVPLKQQQYYLEPHNVKIQDQNEHQQWTTMKPWHQ